MKAGLFAFAMLLMTAGASHAGGLVTRHQSSLQHTVDPTRTITSRTANSFAVAGSGVTMDNDGGSLSAADQIVGGLGTLSTGSAAGDFSTAYQTTAGEAFSYSNSFTSGDATDATGTVSTVYTAGSAGDYSGGSAAPGTIGLDHGLTVTGTTQGAGTSVTAQFVTEVTVID
tara:strand:+ start:806 stop:1318 length:513 start_codon:yes stop_codon:yes gene_type:complete